MAKPYKTKDNRWRVDVELPRKPDGSRHRKPIYGETRQECLKNEFEFRRELEEQNVLLNKDITVAQYFEKWLEINCDQLSPTTVSGYRLYIKRYIIPALGKLRMCDVLQMNIQELINEFIQTHRSKSATNLKGILSKAFNDAIENKMIKTNPCVNIKIKRSKDYEYYIYNENEFNKLLECVKDTIEEIPIVLAALCGMRASEIMGLSWSNVDFNTRRITISQSAVWVEKRANVVIKEPKTNSSNRTIVIPQYVLNVLSKYKKDSGYVYCKANGELESGNAYAERFAGILAKNNLPRTRFHDLRHFNATMMLKLGISDKEASGVLGHTNISMTKKYQHILATMENRVADAIDTIVTIKSNGNQNGNQTSQ